MANFWGISEKYWLFLESKNSFWAFLDFCFFSGYIAFSKVLNLNQNDFKLKSFWILELEASQKTKINQLKIF